MQDLTLAEAETEKQQMEQTMASFVQENSFEIFWCSASWFLVNVVFSGMVSISYVCYCFYSILC